MKFLIFSILIASAYAYPQHNNDYDQRQQHIEKRIAQHETTTWIPILKYNKEQGEDGSYKTEYQTGNNIVHEESGYLKDFSDAHPNGVLVQQGAYSYEAPDGQIIHVQYTADERGFRVTGDHLPTEPPVPEGIRKGLEEIYAGIKRREQENKNNPKYAETAAQRAELDYNGQYYQQ
ncbi:endocuticle structural glycoprotein ABD-4 [Malaya genurostris]|uniref:endocuticle structural glycoprotein ABD-4 n=1 Tax=Malaya genurostris TaxID=325434 RepID=UPI0026F3B808|nr:endocuticle structural glycoprotein ABD-4 [Malaya genurostris]